MKTFHEIVEKYGNLYDPNGIDVVIKDALNKRVIKKYKLKYRTSSHAPENVINFLGGLHKFPTTYVISRPGNPNESRIISRLCSGHFCLEEDSSWCLKIFEAGFFQLYPNFSSNTAIFRAIKQVIPNPWSVELRNDSLTHEVINLVNKLVPDKVWVLSRYHTYFIKDFKVYDEYNRCVVTPRGLTNG